MFKKYYILISCLLGLAKAFAQDAGLHGKVLTAQGAPLPGVKILITPGHHVVTSGPSGNFSVAGLKAGEFVITATRAGYREKKIPVVIPGAGVEIVMHKRITELEEVVVKDNHITTRKNEESLNLDVVKTDFIRQHLGGSLMKTLERLPGVKTIGIGSGQSKPLIRGMGFNRVAVIDNGIKHEGQQWGADHGLEIDQFAAGEIELVKGAASFIYGSDAIAGTINVLPPPPPGPNTMGGSIELIGKTNNNLYGGSANFYARNKKWMADGRVTYQNYADYRVPADTVYVYSYAAGLHKNFLRNTAGRESGLHLSTGYLGEHFRSLFYISNVYSKSGFFANAHGLEPRRVNNALHDRSSRDILHPSQEVNHFKVINKSSLQTGLHLLELELGYQRNFRQEFNQYVNHGYMPSVYPDTLGIPAALERQFDKHVYSLNFRDNFTAGKHRITAGLNTEYQDNKIGGWSFLVPSFNQHTAGIFLYDKITLNDRFLLHAAMRYDYGRLAMQRYDDWFPSSIEQDGETTTKRLTRAENLARTFHSWVWSAGVNYNADHFNAKFNIGKSFRMPIAKELSANGVNYHYFSYEKGDPSLAPEQSYQADLSLGWTSGRLSVQVSPFINFFPNYIYLNPTSAHDYNYGAGNQVFQYAQSRVFRYGGEIQARYQVFECLSGEVSGEYLHAEQLSGNKKGYTLPFSPPPSALFNITWQPGQGKVFRKNYCSLDYRVTGAQNNIVPPEKKTPGYQVFNFQAGSRIAVGRHEVQVNLQVQNLLNTRYLNHTSFYRLIELPEQGRNIVLSLKVPFKIKD